MNTAKLNPLNSPSLKSWGDAPEEHKLRRKNVAIECGWGRLLFAHTFETDEGIAEALREEKSGFRDLAIYLRDPHVVAAQAPQELFIDPSFTYRMPLEDWESKKLTNSNFIVRDIDPEKDIDAINRIYNIQGMVQIDPDFLAHTYRGKFIHYWVAEDKQTSDIIGISMGIDHKKAFDDPEKGSSLWALTVDPQAVHAGIGGALVSHIADYFKKKKRAFLDISVMHNNKEAIALYENLGFQRVPVYCLKNKNAINETLFTTSSPDEASLNPYAMIILNEARRRGIKIEVLDPIDNYFKLSFGGRSVVCRESLSEMTSSVAMSRCADKSTTSRLLSNAGLRVPIQQVAATPSQNLAFLKKYKRLVVKPATGEQGAGITIDVSTPNELASAVEFAQKVDKKVILEEMVAGEDVRIIVIDYKVVAAATRKPPVVIGDGKHTILELIKKQSRRREKATQGESKIPLDAELKRTVQNAGYTLDDILPSGEALTVRRTANLHTGGTIHDITDALHPDVAKAAREAAFAIDIPVVGFDFMMSDMKGTEYAIIEANERPGLANHEPQPTAERFIDLLFPQSATRQI